MREEVSAARDFLSQILGRVAEGAGNLARIYVSLLFAPGREIRGAAAGSGWPFPLLLILGYSVVAPVLLSLAWPTVVRAFGLGEGLGDRRISIPVVFLAAAVFYGTLSGAAAAGVRLFARQRPGALTIVSCVAVAVAPLSAFSLAAWIIVFFSPALALLVLVFGLFAALGFFTEALRSQYDLTVGGSLYAIPLMIAVALLATALFLLALFSRHAAG